MTRTGKIARLPKEIRDQLNQKLADGVPGVRLVEWLNSLPEVHQVLTEQFDGREINEPNLSEWKAGGFLDWQARQELLASAKALAADGADLGAATEGKLTTHLSAVVAAQYAQLLNGWNGEPDEAFMKKLKALRMLGQDVGTLRKGDQRAEALALRRERYEKAQRTDEIKALEVCLDECKQYPEAREAYKQAFELYRAYRSGAKRNRDYQDEMWKQEEAKRELERQRQKEAARAEKEREEEVEAAAAPQQEVVQVVQDVPVEEEAVEGQEKADEAWRLANNFTTT